MPEINKQIRSEAEGVLRLLSFLVIFLMPTILIISFYPFESLVNKNKSPVGSDFIQFYVTGSHILEEPTEIYKRKFQDHKTREIIPDLPARFYLPFRHPPFVALPFYLLSFFPYAIALTLFSILSLFFLWCSARLLLALKISEKINFSDSTILISLLGFPPVIENVVTGQLSTFGLLIVSGAIFCLLRKKYFLTGVILGFGIYKPNLLAIFIFASAIIRPQIIPGLISSIVSILTISWLLLPEQMIEIYYSMIKHFLESSMLTGIGYKRMGLINLINMRNGEILLPFLLGFAFIITTYLSLKAKTKFGENQSQDFLILAIILNLSIIFNPYIFNYDLSLAYPMLLLTVYSVMISTKDNSQFLNTPASKIIVILFFLGPYISRNFAYITNIQIYPLLLVVLLIWQIAQLRKTSSISFSNIKEK